MISLLCIKEISPTVLKKKQPVKNQVAKKAPYQFPSALIVSFN
jgi:hypothetical protein